MNRTKGWVLPGLVPIFFLSGSAGLGYQVVWAKAFGAGIGHEYAATLAVVTAFMLGLALGAFAFDRLPEPLRRYGILEIVIGLWGAVTASLIPWLNRFVIEWLGPDPGFVIHYLAVFGAVFAGLAPASIAMGATLPAMERLLAGTRPVAGLLYGANTAGAALGAVLAAFYIMPALGLRNAILLLAAVNVLCGLAALALRSREAPYQRKQAPKESDRPLVLRLFFAGLLGIGFEAVVIRGLNHLLENTVYTFAAILAVYLAGTACGAALYHRILRRRMWRDEHFFLALAASCILSGIILRFLPGAYLELRALLGDAVWAVAIAESTTAALLFFLPSMLMGATFSKLLEQSLNFRPTLGWSVSVNAVGSALAPAVIGLWLYPRVGLQFSLGVIALGYALLAGRLSLWAVPVAALSIPLLTRSSELIAHPGQKIVFHRDGLMASVSVLESTNGARVLKVNNRFQMGGTAARIAEARHADIPLLLHPNPKRALFIGLGTGITFATAENYPGLIADGVELLPEVVEAMPLFQESGPSSATLNVHVADGRRYVATTRNKYDVVVGDLFHPSQDGAAFLYTKEHFATVRNCLTASGLFCQWLPLFQMDIKTVEIIANTFRSVFPNADLWLLRFTVDTPVVGLIGWNESPAVPADIVERKAAQSERLREHLRVVALGDTLRLLGCRLGRAESLSASYLNTDQRPLILFRAPQLTYRQQDEPGARLLELVERFPVTETGPLGQYCEARNIYLRGLLAESKGALAEAVKLYVQSARVSSEFTSGYAQALGIATTLARSNLPAAQAILRELAEAQPERPVARQLLERLNRN